MRFSDIIAFFTMLTTATTPNAHGVKDIQTSSQAAEPLRPIAGEFAFAIVALGVIGTGPTASSELEDLYSASLGRHAAAGMRGDLARMIAEFGKSGFPNWQFTAGFRQMGAAGFRPKLVDRARRWVKSAKRPRPDAPSPAGDPNAQIRELFRVMPGRHCSPDEVAATEKSYAEALRSEQSWTIDAECEATIRGGENFRLAAPALLKRARDAATPFREEAAKLEKSFSAHVYRDAATERRERANVTKSPSAGEPVFVEEIKDAGHG